jgi:hypothetical protein
MKNTNIEEWVMEEIEYCPISKLKEREAYYVNRYISDPYCLNQNAIYIPRYIRLPVIKYNKPHDVIQKHNTNIKEAISKIFNMTTLP